MFIIIIIIIYLPLSITKIKNTACRLLGEETSGNHQAYRRGHLDITILNEITAAKECGRNLLRNYFNKSSSTLFLKVEKLDKLATEAGRQFQTLGPW